MTTDDLKIFLTRGEDIKTEYKQAYESVPSSFYETVASFSNTDGGAILLGVNDDGAVAGINPAFEVRIKKDLITALNSPDCIYPTISVEPITLKHPDGLVIVVQVPVSSQVHKYHDRIYRRSFETDLDITDDQVQVSDLYLRKRNFFSEAQIIPHLTMADLDPGLFEKARTIIRNFRGDHPWLLVGEDQMLRDASLWRKDFYANQQGLTLAAGLIFGTEQTIQSLLPAYKTEVMVRIANPDRWDDRLTLRKNLIDAYLETKQFIYKYLPEKFYTEKDQRIDLRDKIFREVIGNAIIHREYTSNYSTDIIISGSEVRITNPNKPLFHGLIDPLSFNPYAKNPNIRRFFTALGWADEIGSGIRNTNKYLPLYVEGAKPVFWENELFTTVIPLAFVTLQGFAKQFQQWLGLPDDAFPHLQKGLGFVALPASLKDLSWEELLLHLVPGWHQKGAEFPALKWPEKQLFENELSKSISVPFHTEVPSSIEKGAKLVLENTTDYQHILSEYFEKVPSSTEKGANLLAKKTFNLITILAITTEPVKVEILMEWMAYKKRQSFRELYIVPLQKAGLISKTNPEKKNDPGQQYIITEEGKAFLGGLME